MSKRLFLAIGLILICIPAFVGSFISARGIQPASIVLKSGDVLLAYDPGSKRLKIGTDANPDALVLDCLRQNMLPDTIRKINEHALAFELSNARSTPVSGQITAVKDGTFEFIINGNGKMESDLAFPSAIIARKNDSWVVPDNEGLLIPATDSSYTPWEWGKPFYQGHGGFSMPFIGITNGKSGCILIVETPDDCIAKYKKSSWGRTSSWSINWKPSQNEWRYQRKFLIRYVPEGGYVGIAKAYRQYAQNKGLLVTLREKTQANPHVERLIGAVDLWFWKKADAWWREPDCRAIAAEIKAAGIERVLWANEAAPEAVKTMNSLGFLSGRYDIYQDVWGPENSNPWVNKEGWPDALILKSDGSILNGWVDRYQGKEYPGGVICSKPALDMAYNHVSSDLKTHPYTARFIDTNTASPLRECYNPEHPETRTEDRIYKTELFDYLSGEMKLVTGSETGIDWAVPYLHYFEGMMSIANYRLPDSGYDLTSIKKPQPEFLRFQVGSYYRIPLFELVYHDCVVSYWYWGDASNRLPDFWDIRDLFNLLYGTGPLWIMDYDIWKTNKERFVQSYQTTTTVAKKAGYSELLDHQFLTSDHTVQYTKFANGTEVWVNFSNKPYTVDDNQVLNRKSFLIK